MPQIKTRYKFVGEDREWEETEIIEPVTDVQFYVNNKNQDYNAEKPDDEPCRILLEVTVINHWLHQHPFRKVHGAEYYICSLCGMEAIFIQQSRAFKPLQGWEDPKYEYCREKLPKPPSIKTLKTVDVIPEYEEQEVSINIRELPPLI